MYFWSTISTRRPRIWIIDYKYYQYSKYAVAYAGKNFGEGVFKVMAGLVGVPGAEPPPPGRWRIFENVQKNPKENCKNAIF